MPDPDRVIWEDALSRVRTSHPQLCRKWFETLQPLAEDNYVLWVMAGTPVHSDYLQRACREAFNDALQTGTHRLVQVRFVGPEDDVPDVVLRVAAQNGRQLPPGREAQAKSLLAAHEASARAKAAGRADERPTPGQREQGRGPAGAAVGRERSAGSDNGTAKHVPSSGRPIGADAASEAASRGSDRAESGAGGSVVPGRSSSKAADPRPKNERAVPAAEQGSLPTTGTGHTLESATSAAKRMSGLLPEHRPHPRLHLLDGLTINPDHTFESFVPGPENQLALAAALAVTINPATVYNPLFIHGDVGLGKTHLLQAICIAVLGQRPDASILYMSCEGFSNRFMEAVQASRMEEFRRSFRHVDFLIIDDVHFLGKMARSQEEFYHTFDDLRNSGRQIVVSSDAAPERIPELERRIVSRFQQGLVAEIEAPCYETRLAIVRAKAEMRGLRLPPDVVALIAQKVTGNVRELTGKINTLVAHAGATDRPLDMALALDVLGPVESQPRSTVTMQQIFAAVVEYFDVKIQDLLSEHKHRSIVYPRQIGMHLARKLTRHSLQEIASYFGNRDHTTVMYALRRIAEMLESKQQCRDDVGAVEELVLRTRSTER